jgi:hypothetical protein
MFYCLVVGSRTINDYEYIKNSLDYLLQNKQDITIVSGGAKGVDTSAERYAKEHNYDFVVFQADWDTYGNSAGYIRNNEMHKYISKFSDRGVVAFWDGKSKGTTHNFELAKKYNNPIKIIKKTT